MEQPLSFIPLLLVVFLAFVVPLLLAHARQLRLPIVVGEILAGIIIGRSGLQLVTHEDPALNLLSEFGFVFLMFLSGLEIDFSSLGFTPPQKPKQTKERWGPLSLSLLSFSLTLVISVLIGWGLFMAGLVRNPIMMALILSTTSLGIVVPVLKERGLSSSRFGQTILISALIADFATMLLITVEVAALSHGLTLEILLVGLLFVAFFLTYQFGTIFFNRIPGVRRTMEELISATAQIKTRAAFAMMLIFVGLSEVLGTEIILGAFLAGAMVSLLRRPEDTDAIHSLEAVGFGFFIPIFFIMVGVDFDFQALLSSQSALLLVPILLVAAVAVKIIPTLIYRANYSWRETLSAGVLLSSRLSLIIAASAIGLRLGVISESVNAAVLLVAVLSVTLAPLVFVRMAPGPAPEHLRPIVVFGAGELGIGVANHLRAHNEPVLVFDDDPSHLQRAAGLGLETVNLDAASTNGSVSDFLDGARALVCTMTDVEKSYQVCHQARTIHGIDHVVAHISQPSQLSRFRQLGVVTMNVALDQAAMLVLLTRNPALYQLLTSTEDSKEVTEVVIHNFECIGKKLRHLRLPGDVLILAVRRDGELLVPHGNTQLQEQDHLTLAGSLEHISTATQLFEQQ